MSKKATFCLLVLIGVCQLASSGCISQKAGAEVAKVVFEKMVDQLFDPPIELASSTLAFQQQSGRWPNDYAELRSFATTQKGPSLTNYDRVDFTSNPDGSVAILAVGPGMTNKMTLSVSKKGGD